MRWVRGKGNERVFKAFFDGMDWTEQDEIRDCVFILLRPVHPVKKAV
jgi:hypothetical protein